MIVALAGGSIQKGRRITETLETHHILCANAELSGYVSLLRIEQYTHFERCKGLKSRRVYQWSVRESVDHYRDVRRPEASVV